MKYQTKSGGLDMVKYKKIYSKKVFLELVAKGHHLLWTEPNRNKKWLSVFVLQMDDTLMNDLTEISNK